MSTAIRRIANTALQGGAHNDIQILTLANNGGADTFTLTYLDGEEDEETTGALNDDADAAAILAELEGLTGIGADNVLVTGTNPDFVIEFVGDLGFQAVPLLVGVGTGMDADVTAGTTGYNNSAVDADGVEAEISGAQFFFFAVQEAIDDLNGTFEFEKSKDGIIWSALTLTKASDGTSATEYAAGDPADAFYGQGQPGILFVRATFTGDAFETEVPVVALVAFG